MDASDILFLFILIGVSIWVIAYVIWIFYQRGKITDETPPNETEVKEEEEITEEELLPSEDLEEDEDISE
jgi:hypothetical protein